VLADALAHNACLQSLALGEDAAKEAKDTLTRHLIKVLQSNDKDIKPLAQMLQKNASLTKLDLRDNPIEDVKVLTAALAHNACLQPLALEEDAAKESKDAFARHLIKVLQSNDKEKACTVARRYLSLGYNDLNLRSCFIKDLGTVEATACHHV